MYKAVEPFVYSVIVYHARLSIADNIQKVLDHYNEDNQTDYINNNNNDHLIVKTDIKTKLKNSTCFSLALNGNRINTKVVNQYNDYINNLLKQNSELPKSQNFAFGDLNSSYICPNLNVSLKDNTFDKHNTIWLYFAALIPHIKSIPVPPPQSIIS